MKSWPLLAAFILFLSCNESQPVKRPANLPPIKRDTGTVQTDVASTFAPIDISPVDIAYFPVDYPVAKMTHQASAQPVARVIYSRPHRQGRTIFGSLIKYGEPWRLGANEATEIELFQPVTIQGKSVAKGRYILYCIPKEHEWTIVFNKNIFSWGLRQDQKEDAYRFTLPVEPTPAKFEYFTMAFEKTPAGAHLLMAWDAVQAKLPITF